MAEKNVADLMIETLGQAGVRRIYGVVGDSLNGVTEALRKNGKIEWVHVRHEEVAAFAAAAEGQLDGTLAVCAGSCGPGNLHLINGLFDAHRSRTPVLAIAAQIPSAEIGGGYFQETHPQDLFRECSHYCEMVTEPAQMPYVLENAIRAAVGQRGVAVVVLPGDVALKLAPSRAVSQRPGLLPAAPSVVPNEQDMQQLAKMLNDASRITLLCGRGCAGAHDALMKLAGALKSPIVHALGGKEHVEYDNPFDVGMTGLIGFSSGYAAIESCDLLLMLGTDFPYKQFFPTYAKVVQVDIRPEQLGRRCRLDLGLVGDVRATIDALMPQISEKSDGRHLEKSLAHYRKAREGLDELARGTAGKKPVHPQYVARVMSETAAEDAVFTADVGTPTVWSARYLKMNGKRRLIGSFAHGSMANALAHAIGVQAAEPDRQVISFSGDGGLSMLMGDLLTLVQHDLPVKIVVLNNGILGFVALEMKTAGMVTTGTDLTNPNFADMAKAIGIHGIRVEDPGDLPGAMVEHLAHKGPSLLDVVSAKQELIVPPTVTIEEMKGFSLYMARAVMNGRGDEIVDLARENIGRR